MKKRINCRIKVDKYFKKLNSLLEFLESSSENLRLFKNYVPYEEIAFLGEKEYSKKDIHCIIKISETIIVEYIKSFEEIQIRAMSYLKDTNNPFSRGDGEN